MYVVLVDDEQWIVTGLSKILQKRYPDMRILCFCDPQQAAGHMTEDMPDLLITDIRMPQISGMELIARMRSEGLKHYAVLTGLNDVQLLQESIRMQVSDYLIKPVNKTELFALVDRTIGLLQEEKSRRRARLKDQLRLCAQYGAQAADVSLMQEYRTMLLTMAAAQLPPAAEECFSFRVKLHYDGQEIMLHLSETETDAAAQQLKDCRLEGMVLAGFDPEQLQQQLAEFDAGQKDEIALLARRYARGEGEEAAELLWQLLKACDCPPLALDRFCRLIRCSIPLWIACYEARACVTDQKQPQELAALLKAQPQQPTPRSSDVAAVLAWIEKHYKEEITLSQAAASVFLQANYFTTLFKKEMGVGFVQYLNQYRVEEACRLILTDGSMSFAQIAQETGFASQRHFFATFKKYTGHPPGGFRQLMEEAGFTGN